MEKRIETSCVRMLTNKDSWFQRNRSSTAPQKTINSLLGELNISYANEQKFGYYAADNFLSDYNLIIEVMGDYWHTNPLKYDFAQYEMQKRVIKTDRAKHDYILNNHRIEILYLWETDINKHIDVCRHLILSYVENDGILQDYHSFNYHIDNDSLVLNTNIITPHQDKQTILIKNA